MFIIGRPFAYANSPFGPARTAFARTTLRHDRFGRRCAAGRLSREGARTYTNPRKCWSCALGWY